LLLFCTVFVGYGFDDCCANARFQGNNCLIFGQDN
jgi:hypothetical protein